MTRRVALVTGGTRGIGLGIARCLATEGLDLALCGVRQPAAVAEVVAELEQAGVRVVYCRADVSDRQDRHTLLGSVQEAFGRLDVLVNNAGVAPAVRADVLEATEESFERLVRINLQGPYFLTQAVARWMVAQAQAAPGWQGFVVNVTSVSATVPSVDRGDYCLTKAALAMSTRLWAVRLAEHGISVYEVRPGIVRTDMTAAVQDKYDRLIAGGLTLQPRWGLPEDVGRAVAMLVRGDLGYSTGSVVMVDGGMSVPRL